MKNSKNSKTPKKKKLNRERPSYDIETETLEQLLDRLGISDWDVLLVGDGSGSNWGSNAGWASVSIEREGMTRTIHTGATNSGTVNFAEIMAYLQPLDWLTAKEIDRREKSKLSPRAYRVHIITDSEYCSITGNSGVRLMAKNPGVWTLLDAYARNGFIIKWHHIRGHTKGEGCMLNKFCDKLSKLSRKKIADDVESLVEKAKNSKTIEEFNPGESE